MKKFLLGISLILFVFHALPQENRPCRHPVPLDKFRQDMDILKDQANEMQRLRKAKDIVSESCFSASQVKEMAELFKNDQNRLEFAEAAYENTTDKQNFYDVFDSFARFSSVMKLYDFIGKYPQEPQRRQSEEHNQPPEQHHMPPQEQVPPPCIVTAEDFSQAKNSISKQSFDNTRLTLAKQIINNARCFTSLQVKEILALFSFEESKLELAKFAYDYTLDKRNYFVVNDAFSFSTSTDELAKYINSKH